MLDVTKLELTKKQADIITAANDLFQKFGIKRVSVEEICQTAGVSKMTFYKYFQNKSDLVRYMWEKGFEQAFAKFDEINEMDIPFTEKLHLMLKLKEESVAKFSHQYALDYFYATPDLKDFFDYLARKSISHFIAFIEDAQEKGEVRADLHPEFLLAIINNIKFLVKDEELVNKYPSYKDFVMEINNFIYYGILPRPQSG